MNIVAAARTMDDLHGMPIIVLPDDDEMFDELVFRPDCILSDGARFYVPESKWPALRTALLSLREPK